MAEASSKYEGFAFEFSADDLGRIAAQQLSQTADNRKFPIEFRPIQGRNNFGNVLGFRITANPATQDLREQFDTLQTLFVRMLPENEPEITNGSTTQYEHLKSIKYVLDGGSVAIHHINNFQNPHESSLQLQISGDPLIATLIDKGVTFPGSEVAREKAQEHLRSKDPLTKFLANGGQTVSTYALASLPKADRPR